MSSYAHAERFPPAENDRLETVDRSACADWSAYAKAYDLMSDNNPAYQALLDDFEAFLSTIEAPKRIYDIGGGTGNYTQIAARAFPDSEIHFVEPDVGMREAAQSKLAGYDAIKYDTVTLESFDVKDTADLIICVHALYAMPGQKQRLADLRRLLRPGGMLYLVDLGRPLDVEDWRKYMFINIKNKYGLTRALQIFWHGREVAKQNKAIFSAQKKGVYWTHTEEEITSAVTEAGFEVLRQQSVYRGYSDLLVCRAKP
ncbi:class I SAM-dependent methyltransferase [Celeribacter persicus]|uniref:Ubiquinone/menaquinone biosynthesis C-methylase UbiE n=1 Tax=Celeribacter persicus TaxID=1651082 RepID=A0A2T5H465_9RHOB|nr:methyltransferase [Celeribacter persicus]PTQ66401.1 ubiquinone/menaquinone biosynthesis C-methylase UbiE [Celeribacter persicus]